MQAADPEKEPTTDTVEVEAASTDSASGVVTQEPPTEDASSPVVIQDDPAPETAPVDDASDVSTEAADGAEAAAETVEAATDGAEALANAAETVVTGVPPQFVFLGGIAILGMFLYYLATEKTSRKKYTGTVLAFCITAVCIWLFKSEGLEQGIELQGGVSMEIRIHPNEEGKVTETAQQQAIEVLTNRLNKLGTGEVVLAPSGEDGIFLQMPGVGQEKLEEITGVLQQVALLEFSILHPQSRAGLATQVANGAQVIPGYEAIPYKPEFDENGNELPTQYGLVKIKRDMKGKYVNRAGYFYGDSGHSISVRLKSEGADIMGPLSAANLK
ncbi:MAG: hypothetical protein AAGF67_15790, partial [Verrucomicrobiota bacterium]